MIKYQADNVKYNVRQWNFPGGEVGVDINTGSQDPCVNTGFVTVDARLQNSNDVMALLLVNDALRRQFPLARFALSLAYVPYGRQDRVCNSGESHSLKVFASLINSMNFTVVEIADPHSSVSTALIDNVQVIDQFDIFGRLKNFAPYVIVAPDMGAQKKAEDFARRVGAKGVLSFNKKRELSTGKITGIYPTGEIDKDQNYLVLDDICDGGRTFLELAKHFHDGGEGKLELMVTHGIFSKGISELLEEYDHIYTTNSFRDDLLNLPKMTILKKF